MSFIPLAIVFVQCLFEAQTFFCGTSIHMNVNPSIYN